MPCSVLIPDCNRCNNSNTCYECQGNAALIDNNTCLPKEIIEDNPNYFKDEITNKYISCSIINNCVTCESSTKCLSCENGFDLKNDICINKESDSNDGNDNNDDNNKLSTAAILGIVFGCLGFLLILAGTGYFLFNKFIRKNNFKNTIETVDGHTNERKKIDVVQEDTEKVVEEIKDNIVVHTNKRSISNKKE